MQVKFKFYVPYLKKYQSGPLECAATITLAQYTRVLAAQLAKCPIV